MIFLTCRHAARRDDEVVVQRRSAQRLPRGVQAVGHDAQVIDNTARRLQQTPQHETVAVVDGAGFERLAGHHQFVAG